MDFFEAQALAKKRTGRLVALFAFAVVGTVLAGYGAALLIQALMRRQGMIDDPGLPASSLLWQPGLFLPVALGALALIGFSSLAKWASFREGGSAVAHMLGGRQVDPHTRDLKERQLLNVVEEMAIASGTAVPATYLLPDDPSINAFAAGLTTHDAVVAVTRGTLDSLTRDELQAVIGHEFSHILNGDMRLNLRLASILFGILVIGLIGQGLFRGLHFMRFSGGSSRGGKKGGAGGILLLWLLVAVATLIIGYVGFFFGRLIQAAVSRQREFLADASAVQFTRNPAGLTGALKKIGGQSHSPKLASPKAAQINHSFFSQAFESKFGGGFATHPPLDIRIRAIDPQFDGKFVRPEPSPPPRPAPPPKPASPPPLFPGTAGGSIALDPAALLATIGVLSAAGTDHAHQLLESLGDDLREAARTPASAEPLVYALMLDADDSARQPQLALLPPAAADPTRTLFAAVNQHPVDARLPLAQLILVGLRQLDPPAQSRVISTLEKLARADNQVTPFEYALQRVIAHGLEVARAPAAQGGQQIYSFSALARPISVALSTLAHAGAEGPDAAARAFEAGRPQLPLLQSADFTLVAENAIGLNQLDTALDRLSHAAPPIKQRVVASACAIIAADGSARSAEIELLRAMCAALDVPMPPVPAPSS